MRTVIAGSRALQGPTNAAALANAISLAAHHFGITPTVVLSGCAPGVDTLGEEWARANGLPVERHPANWAKYGNRAGHLRNATMAHQCDAVIALWDGVSKGTLDMVQLAVGLDRPVYLCQVPPL